MRVLFLALYLFFFFKQKTAYEMRISNWSSDVCSSDLAAAPRPGARGGLGGGAPALPRGTRPRSRRARAAFEPHPLRRRHLRRRRGGAARGRPLPFRPDGSRPARASPRDRRAAPPFPEPRSRRRIAGRRRARTRPVEGTRASGRGTIG